MNGTYLLGIDAGTSGAKCMLIDSTGKNVATATHGYPLSIPHPNWSEQNPSDWADAALKGIREVLQKSGINPSDIKGIGFSGQMHGLVALDEGKNVIRPAILWNDQRNGEECAKIIETAGGLEGLLGYTNNTMLPGYTGGKILWLKKHEPQNYGRMRHFLMPKDYVRFCMTGEIATDVSEASGTGLFDVKRRAWSGQFISLLGFDKSVFPKTYESDETAGAVTKEFADRSGLAQGTRVYAGGGDAVIQNAGMGIVSEGTIGLVVGTSGVVAMALNDFGKNEGGSLQVFCGNAKGKYMAFGCQLSCGGSMEWFKENFYEGPDAFARIDAEVRQSPVGAKNLYFLPYLTGERCPYADPYARGVFFGLSLSHTKGDMARAVMEGVTFGLKQIYNLILAARPGLKPEAAISSGGGSKSRQWLQMQADIFNLPVKTLESGSEGGAYGAALVAGVGAGVWKSLEEACATLKLSSVTNPMEANVRKYESSFKVYDGLYGDLKPVFEKMRGEGQE